MSKISQEALDDIRNLSIFENACNVYLLFVGIQTNEGLFCSEMEICP